MISKHIERVKEELLASWKWIASFSKLPSRWKLKDYPVVFRHYNHSDFTGPSRLKPVEWLARIVCWSMTGSGDTKQEAFENLQIHLEERRQRDGILPRPGTKIPIEFASQEQISAYGELEREFVDRILGLEWAWISDESSLWDFHELEDNQEHYCRIQEIYGVDVSDVPDAKIVGILAKISACQR